MQQIQKVITPPLFLLRLCGITHIFYDTAQKKFRCSQNYTFWSTVFLTVIFLVTFYILNYYYYHIIQVPKLPRFTLRMIYTLYLYTPSVFLLIILISIKLKQNDIVRFSNALLKLPRLKKQTRIFRTMTVGIIVETFLFNFCFFIPGFVYPVAAITGLKIQYVIYTVVINYNHVACIIVEVVHFAFLHFLCDFFSYVEEVLKEASARRRTDKMRQSLKLYQELFENTRQINGIFSVSLLLLIGMHFMYFYIYAFTVYSEIVYKPHTGLKYVSMYAIVIIALRLYYYIFVANRTMTQANGIKRTAIDIVIKTWDKDVRKEINALALQLCHEKVRIVAGDFFTIDYPLLFEMKAACSTYMIITIQFIEIHL